MVGGRGSLPARLIQEHRGVSLLWGLCEALWGRLLVSGCTFSIGCFCLAKTQWDSRLLKDAVSLSYSLQEIISLVLITSYSIDETILFWWDHLILMGLFCVINIWMESECQCDSHPEHRDYTPPLTDISFSVVCRVEKGLSTLYIIPGNKGGLLPWT